MKKKNFHLVAVFLLLLMLSFSCKTETEETKMKYWTGSTSDVEGNHYKTVKYLLENGDTIEWMAENLKTSHYQTGDPIPYGNTNTAWSKLKTGALCNFAHDTAKVDTFGRLYNYYAAKDPRGLCPQGWHVPSDFDWLELTKILGDSVIAGGKLKLEGTSQWLFPNIGGTNESGFSAIPGGYRNSDGKFYFLDAYNRYGYWWTSTDTSTTMAMRRYLVNFRESIERTASDKKLGLSIRCMRDR